MRVVLALIVVLVMPALGWQGPEGTATVRGHVVDAQTGRPLRNLFINFYPQSQGAPGIDPEPPKRSAITDDSGAFAVASLAAGDYAISAGRTGYLSIEYGISRPGGPSKHLRVADRAQLDVDVRAWRSASIGGHVYDERGRPVIGAQVRVFEKESEVYGSSTSDDRGAYEIAGLAPGQYTVGVPVWLRSRTLSANPPRQATPGFQPLEPYVLDRGLHTVLLTNGAPVAPSADDGHVQVYVTSFAGGASTKRTAAYTRVDAGEERDNIDIVLPAVRGTRVSGIVAAAGDVTGTILRLMPEGSLTDADAGGMEATVARDGTFVFAATPPGKYLLTGYRRRPPLTDVTLAGGTPSVAWDDVIMNDDEDMWAEMPLGIGDGDIDNLVVTLTPGTPLTGRVAIEDDASAGPRRRQVRIALTTDARHSFDDRFVAVRPDGSISMRIRPGAYRILCSGDEEGRTFKTAIVNGQDIGDGPLIVGGEPLRDVQFVFGRFDTVLQGSIVEADGTASPDATVVAIPAERDKWFRLEESGHAKVARTTSGAYRIASLPPGEYYVVALHQFLGPPSAPVAAALTRIATRVTIRSGEPATVALVARDRE